jgi:hypothetical protein
VPGPPTPPKLGATSPLAALATAARNGPPRARSAAPSATPDSGRDDTLVVRPNHPGRGVGLAAHVRRLTLRHWRRLVVLVVVGIALSLSIVAVWPVLFRSEASKSSTSVRAAQEAVATDLLRTVVGGGRSYWSSHHSFAGIAPATLSNFSYAVPVVTATTNARAGAVSLRVDNAGAITLATPADSDRCVFARDEPAAARTRFVTMHTHSCRASAAPATGWTSR